MFFPVNLLARVVVIHAKRQLFDMHFCCCLLRSLLYNRWCKWLQTQKTEQTDSASPPPLWVIAISKRLGDIDLEINKLQADCSSESASNTTAHGNTGVDLACKEEMELLIRERTQLQQEKKMIEVTCSVPCAAIQSVEWLYLNERVCPSPGSQS